MAYDQAKADRICDPQGLHKAHELAYDAMVQARHARNDDWATAWIEGRPESVELIAAYAAANAAYLASCKALDEA